MSETEKELHEILKIAFQTKLHEILKIAFQTNVDESDYIRDSEVSHIYDKKQKKYLDFYNKRNQSNLHGLFQTKTPEVLSKAGFYPLSLDEQLRLLISHANLDKLSFDESNNLLCKSN